MGNQQGQPRQRQPQPNTPCPSGWQQPRTPYPPPPYYYPPMPPPPMKRPPLRSKDIFWIIVAIAVGLLFICVVIGNTTNPQNSTTATPDDQTITDTPMMDTQAAIPTVQPTPLLFQGTLRGIVLGRSQDAFTTNYGQPSSNIGEAFFYSNLQVGVLKGTRLVFTLLVGAPEHRTWTMATGMVQCASFLPADGERQESFKTFDGNQQDGLAVVYVSVALGQVFPASQFADINHHLVTPGTFTVAYTYLFDKQKISGITTCFCNARLTWV